MSQLKENQVLMLQVRQGKVKSHKKLRTDLVQRKDQIQNLLKVQKMHHRQLLIFIELVKCLVKELLVK